MKFLIAVFAICLSVATTSAHAQTVADGYAAYDVGDYEKAKTIFVPLAKAGDAKAMNAIGIMIAEGRGYQKDDRASCDWQEKAAEAGFYAAQSNVAVCYEIGEGRKKDLNKAIYWYEKAAKQGHVDSQIDLLFLYEPIDKEKAQFWGQKAVNQGSVLAKVAMRGYGFPHTGPPASLVDMACVYMMIGVLGEDRNYCD